VFHYVDEVFRVEIYSHISRPHYCFLPVNLSTASGAVAGRAASGNTSESGITSASVSGERISVRLGPGAEPGH
jgi:hypothetical protein